MACVLPGSFTGSNPGVSGLTVTGMSTPKATLQNSGCCPGLSCPLFIELMLDGSYPASMLVWYVTYDRQPDCQSLLFSTECIVYSACSLC